MASGLMPMRSVMNGESSKARSSMFASESLTPSMPVSSRLTRRYLSSPYWLYFAFHHEGVSLPRTSEKLPGQVQVPTSTPLTVKVISLGQALLDTGYSLDSSSDTSSICAVCPSASKLGMRYSTYPSDNHSSEAWIRSFDANVRGSSNLPMTSFLSANPHVGWTLTSLK